MRKPKKYKSKNRLFFSPLGLLKQMRLRFDEFVKIHGKPPVEIYLPKEQYLEYREEILRVSPRNSTDEVVFRGAKIYEQ